MAVCGVVPEVDTPASLLLAPRPLNSGNLTEWCPGSEMKVDSSSRRIGRRRYLICVRQELLF